MRNIKDAFYKLSEDQRRMILSRFGFDAEEGNYEGFLAWISQSGKAFDLIMLIVDISNPIDPRYIC
jgi:hypothetical protein